MPFKIIWKLLKWRHCSVSAGSDNENYLTQLKFIFYKMLEVSHEEYQCAIIETQVCNAQKRQSYIKEYWVSYSSPENRIHKDDWVLQAEKCVDLRRYRQSSRQVSAVVPAWRKSLQTWSSNIQGQRKGGYRTNTEKSLPDLNSFLLLWQRPRRNAM